MQNSNKHSMKYIAPVVVTILLLIYFAFCIAVCVFIPTSFFIKVIVACILLFFAGVCIYIFVERISEIRSGEEDDLSQY